MGSWDEYCAISRIGIGCGDRAVAIFLKKKWEGYIFSSLPIRGTYDDYGRLDDLDNPEFLINFDFDQNDDMEIIWFHEEMFDYYSNNILTKYVDIGPELNTALTDYIKSDILELLGFELQEDVKLDDRYDKTYKHPENDKIFIGSDGTWIKIFDGVQPFKPDQYIYSSKEFVKFWEETTKIKLNVEPLLEFPKWYFSIFKEFEIDEKFKRIYAAYNASHPNDPPMGGSDLERVLVNADNWKISENLYLDYSSYELMPKVEFVKYIAKMTALRVNMQLTNIPLHPNHRGCQYTNNNNIQILLNLTKTLLDKKINVNN